jgi:hypothetical protein
VLCFPLGVVCVLCTTPFIAAIVLVFGAAGPEHVDRALTISAGALIAMALPVAGAVLLFRMWARRNR